MKITLKTCTALTVILALTSAAGAGMNNMPIPQIVRPVITPPVDVRHLAPRAQRRKSANNAQRATGRRAMTKAAPRKKANQFREAARTTLEKLALPKHPPLPHPRPDFAASGGAAGLENGRFGQGGQARLDDLARRAGDLLSWAELARFGDLKEAMAGRNAVDETSIGDGDGGSRSGFDWKGMVPESNTADAGPQNDNIWRPEAPTRSAYNRDPYGDQHGGFTPPQFGGGWQRASDKPGMSHTAGSATSGAGLRFGGRGETSQDGSSQDTSQDGNSQDSDGNPPRTVAEAREIARNCATDCDVFIAPNSNDGARAEYKGGGFVEVTTYMRGRPSARYIYDARNRLVSWGMYDKNGNPRTLYRVRPDSQPLPDEAGSQESMPCPAGLAWCGPPPETVMGQKQATRQDKVSQPGAEDAEPGEGGFKASVAERKGVVTNPVDPANYVRTDGGRGPPPIQHVTQPGGASPDRPGR